MGASFYASRTEELAPMGRSYNSGYAFAATAARMRPMTSA